MWSRAAKRVTLLSRWEFLAGNKCGSSGWESRFFTTVRQDGVTERKHENLAEIWRHGRHWCGVYGRCCSALPLANGSTYQGDWLPGRVSRSRGQPHNDSRFDRDHVYDFQAGDDGMVCMGGNRHAAPHRRRYSDSSQRLTWVNPPEPKENWKTANPEG